MGSIDDFSYANGQLGFGYVADGTGHNNPMMATVLKRVFNEFNEQYELAHTNATFKSLEDYREFVEDQLMVLGNAIHTEPEPVVPEEPRRPGMTRMNEPTLKPAFSFAQIARLGDKRVLISAQYSDTMLLIKKADGSFDTTLASKIVDYGLGERNRKIEKVIRDTEVGPGDVIYGFSDGFGEFLTMKECQEIISANRDPGSIFTELKNKIIENGKNFVQGENTRQREKQVPSANGQKFTKFHLPHDKNFHDDISMFSLFVK
jgi:serine/threonine protein phosphatase PrpC